MYFVPAKRGLLSLSLAASWLMNHSPIQVHYATSKMLSKQHFLAAHRGYCPTYREEMDTKEASQGWYESLTPATVEALLFCQLAQVETDWTVGLHPLNMPILGAPAIPSTARVVVKVRRFLFFSCQYSNVAGLLCWQGFCCHPVDSKMDTCPKYSKPWTGTPAEILEKAKVREHDSTMMTGPTDFLNVAATLQAEPSARPS